MKFLRSLLNRRTGSSQPAVPAAPFPLPAPDRPLCVIGDVHGRADLLASLVAQIEAHPIAGAPECDVIFVGDYIDRGEDSQAVLKQVQHLAQSRESWHALQGNHEVMMTEFLEDPGTNGRRWLRFGGLQTLASFGVGGVGETSDQDTLSEAAAALRAALPQDMEDWLHALPLQWQSGNVHVVHAAADPELPMSLQPHKTLVWGSSSFANTPRSDGQWVVYGHTITDTPGADAQGRIAVDTGAYYSGRLTAALILPDGNIELLQT